MSEITWAGLTTDQQKALKEYESGLCSDITRQNWWFLRDNGLITAEELTFAGRAVLAQADSAKPEGVAVTFSLPTKCHYDETLLKKGYNEGYEAAAKIAREQYALVDYWTDKNAELQAELATACEQVASLRAALEPFARTYQTWLERPNTDVVFVDWLKAHLGKNTGAAYRHFRKWFEQAAVLAGDEGGA